MTLLFPSPVAHKPLVDACELTILMPCLNEARTLGVCITKARGFLESSGVDGEIVVADNGSTDGSRELAASLGARVVPIARRGYGAALQGGIEAARGRYVIMGDSDDSYDFVHLQGFVDKLREGFELVMGNRFRGGIEPDAMPFLHRYLGNPMLTFIGRKLFRCRTVGDFYCGLRGFDRQAIRTLNVQSPGMEFALEMIVKAHISGLHLTEVPTTLKPDGRDRRPHLRTFRDGWRSLRLFLVMSPRWLFAYPGIALALIGLLGFLTLLFTPITLGRFNFDFHTQLYMAAAIVLGNQAILMSVLAKQIAMLFGLHPPSRFMARLSRVLTLERLVVGGAGLVALGLLIALGALLQWSQLGFGAMELDTSRHLVAVSILCMVVGGQTIIGGFLVGLLQMLHDRYRST